MAVRQRHLKRKDSLPPVAAGELATDAAGELAMADSKEDDAAACSLEQPLMGRTSDGTAFVVPKTRDMLQSLFNPFTPKTTFDIITLATLSTHLMVALLFPLAAKRKILMASFAFWRLCYNGGLGWILNWQSSRHGLVAMFKRNGWLDSGRGGKIYLWLKSELEAKMGPDYSFEAVPIEFNAWLLYRQLVDLILLNDFTAYFFLCTCYVGSASDSEPWHAFLRIAGGLILLVFNLWVKIDAHRVVKDYAWYWGDFFFLVEQSLTFDGVFEMAPHPMYSIGYAGYYGGSLITGSYTIFYASLAAHMLQFLFLSLVENPHIEKTYERPPLAVQVIKRSRNRRLSSAHHEHDDAGTDEAVASGIASSIRERPTSLWHPDLIIFKNFDLFRASDVLIMLLLAYSVAIPLGFMWATGHVQLVLVYSICQCVGWILFRTLALGFLLKRQSTNQLITRWYIKHGGNGEEAFSSWRAVCNTATIMTYGSFALVSLAAYHWGDADFSNLILFHTFGVLLIAFHVWSSRSVYETLGDFGWFYGDFFARDSSMLSLAPADIKLYYTGIYRYLNNPEKVIGQAAFYGLALISRSWAVFALALLLQVCYFLFSAYVETPHMEKIYGAQMRRESGIVRTVKKAVNLSIGQPLLVDGARYTDGDIHHISEDAQESSSMVNLLANTAKPVKDILLETKGLLSTTTARLAERALPSELSTIDHLGLYGLKLLPGRAWKSALAKNLADKAAKSVYFLGEPIRVSWQAPLSHSRRDWIGIYPVTANFSNQITTVNSKGRYVYIHPDENLLAEMVVGDSIFTGVVKGTTSVKEGAATTAQKGHPRKRSTGTVSVLQGEALFSSSALPFRVGAYEMRLHHGGTHAVLAQSKPFEIAVCDAKDIVSLLGDNDGAEQREQADSSAPADGPDTLDGLSLALLTVVNKIFAVTDSRAMPVASPRDLGGDLAGDICVETDIVEPLESVHDSFSVDEVLDEKQARRLGYAIKEYFGVEFSSDVLIHAAKHGATVHDVAKRIIEARKALSAYSSANF
ncbi:phosphatidylethanolamine N-methyltransferase [Coemansia aciculifera]|uniref:Phosphatidylethanolamine N-methyltransferase n=1 Tax=Coemansia aciculifera TaxID=417176 RepID=A0ACC1M4X3_9FUNG|nr:phosphatidylethanolamine N-methyltransferase [Coemansia aciculifera]